MVERKPEELGVVGSIPTPGILRFPLEEFQKKQKPFDKAQD